MGKMKLASCGMVAIALASAAPASAATTLIDFEDLAHSLPATYFPSVTSNGFTFTNTNGSPYDFVVWGNGWPYSADVGGATLGNNYGGSTTTFSRVGGGVFDLTSIDLADIYNNALGQQGGDVLFTFNDAAGSTTQTVTIDGTPGLQTFTFNRSNLLSASYQPLTTYGPVVQVDNVLINGPDNHSALAVPAVPEPDTWAMMLLGLGVIGFVMRRRTGRIGGQSNGIRGTNARLYLPA